MANAFAVDIQPGVSAAHVDPGTAGHEVEIMALLVDKACDTRAIPDGQSPPASVAGDEVVRHRAGAGLE